MKFSTSPAWALAAILFFDASIIAFAYSIRVGAGLVALPAVLTYCDLDLRAD